MEETLKELLTNAGPLAVVAIVLIQSLGKRIDKLTEAVLRMGYRCTNFTPDPTRKEKQDESSRNV